jgi:hypothetical protein
MAWTPGRKRLRSVDLSRPLDAADERAIKEAIAGLVTELRRLA